MNEINGFAKGGELLEVMQGYLGSLESHLQLR